MMDAEGFYTRKRVEYPLVLAFFFLLAAAFTWPLILHAHNGIVGGHGDPLLNTWIVNWDARTIFTHPSRLFQGNIIFPSRDVLAYSEHQFTLGLIGAPVHFIFRNPILTYNFLVFFCFVASGFGCYLLLKELSGSRWGGLAAGVFYTFCFYHLSQLSHIQIFFMPFIPFMVLYLYRYLERGGRWNLFLFGLFLTAQSLTSWHALLYCAIAAGLLWLWTAAFTRRGADWKRLAWVAAAVVVAALIMLPFVMPYLRAHRRLPGFERSLEEVELYGAKAEDYLRVLDVSVMYGDAPAPFRAGGIGFENVLYPGATALVLAAAGLFLRRREEEEGRPVYGPAYFRKGVMFFLIMGALSVLLAFGPRIGGVENPFYMVPYRLGLLKFTRVPTRFYNLAALALAALAGYGAAKLALRSSLTRGWKGFSGWRIGRLTGLALVALLALEILTFNLYVHPIPVYGDVPDVYEWLKEQGDVRVIELPTHALGPAGMYDRDLKLAPLDIFEYLYREGDIMYLSTYHWKKVVNGYSGYSPFSYRRTITEMQGFPSQRSVDLLRGLGVDYVIWDWDWVPAERGDEFGARLSSAPGLSLVGDFQNKSVFRVDAGPVAAPEDMEVRAVAPAAVTPGAGFNLGLLVNNPSGAPMVCTEEEWQDFTLVLSDGAGNALEVAGEYRPPFFVDAGETISLPLQAGKAVPAGDYDAELRLAGGVLGDRSFSLALEVREMPDSDAPGVLDGNAVAGREALTVPGPDGLHPLMTVTATNTGDTLWRAPGQLPDYTLPPGCVHIALSWTEADGSVWEEQAGSLPCDVSPGQAVEVPLLVRPPGSPGAYVLRLGLFLEGTGWIGEVIDIGVTVEGWIAE